MQILLPLAFGDSTPDGEIPDPVMWLEALIGVVGDNEVGVCCKEPDDCEVFNEGDDSGGGTSYFCT